MSDPSSPASVLEPLREEGARADLTPEARARVIASMRAQVREVPRVRQRARRVRRLFLASSMALAAAGVWLWQMPSEPALQLRGELIWADGDSAGHPVHGSDVVHGDGQLTVPPGGRGDLLTPAGVRLHAVADTQLRVRDRARHVSLARGAVHCKVPQLGPTGSFVVAAGASQVIVHGTDFSVALHDDPTTPCVRVREGKVEVRTGARSVFLGPQDSWGCAEPPAPASEPPVLQPPARAEASAVEPPPERPRPRRRRARARSVGGEHSTLEHENALLAEALHAERESERGRARTLFEELLRRYPRSPLAPEAQAGARRNAP